MSGHRVPHESPGSTERDPGDGFDAVMERIQRLTPQQIEALRLQAESAELGHDAYAVGRKHLDLGEPDEGEYWLRMAARHGVAEARRVLEERGITVPDPPPRPAIGVVSPASRGSLPRGMPPSVPGTIFAFSVAGGIALDPGDGRQIHFGRDRPEVHVCIGEDDPRVSRHQGTLAHSGGRWWLLNTGYTPIRIVDRYLFPDEEPLTLDTGYTSIFIYGSAGRQHLLEVFVADADRGLPSPRHADTTEAPKVWRLEEDERLVLVVLGQRYLTHEPYAQPLSWVQAAAQLAELRPEETWTRKRVEYVVTRVRARLVSAGVPGLTRQEVGEPVGNTLNHNLITELLMSATLIPLDLALIDAGEPERQRRAPGPS